MRIVQPDLGPSVQAVAALEDDTRRELYLFVRGEGGPVTRDTAAASAGISERLAAYHLDRLVEVGLLRAHYARKPGRSGPGAGRTSKYYEPSDLEVDVTMPERRYAFMGEMLVAGIAEADRAEPARTAAIRVMGEHGVAAGRKAGKGMRRGRSGKRRPVEAVREVLSRWGYEPIERSEGTISLRNCPYRQLARQAPEVVCRMNHAFVDGVLTGLGGGSLRAEMVPMDGECCVRVVAE
jgi:predicted ArsR family transcriptional regulator